MYITVHVCTYVCMYRNIIFCALKVNLMYHKRHKRHDGALKILHIENNASLLIEASAYMYDTRQDLLVTIYSHTTCLLISNFSNENCGVVYLNALIWLNIHFQDICFKSTINVDRTQS